MLLMNVTFDTNCLIDLEEDRPAAEHLRHIVEQAAAGRVTLRTVAISASERRPDGTYARNFSEFQEKVASVGLQDFESLPPLLVLDVTYLDHSLLGSDELSAQARRIHEVLFPDSPFDYTEYCADFGIDPEANDVDRKWKNRLCDTLALWAHLHSDGGVFVTSDENFHKQTKRNALAGLGAEVLRPDEAAMRCETA